MQAIIFFLFAANTFLYPGDGIYLKVWRQPDLSDTYFVDLDTTLSLPLIGKIDLNGVDLDRLTDTLRSLLGKFVKDPFITVVPIYRVSVIGEVNRPGVYSLKNTDRIFEAIALAGGPTSKADLGRTKIRRGNKIIGINLKKEIEKGTLVGELGIRSGDVIIVPRTWFPTWQEWYFIMAAAAFGWSVYSSLRK